MTKIQNVLDLESHLIIIVQIVSIADLQMKKDRENLLSESEQSNWKKI